MHELYFKNMASSTQQVESKAVQKGKEKRIERRYKRYFSPELLNQKPNERFDFSLEQPSQFEWVSTETTYGIDVMLSYPANAKLE